MAETLIEALRAARTGGLRFLDRRENAVFLPWSEVLTRAEALGRSLRSLGILPGERVILVFATGPQFFDAFFGVMLAGGVPVPIYPPVRLGRMEEYRLRTSRMITLFEAPLVLAESRVRRVIGEAVAQSRPRLGCWTPEELPRAGGELVNPRPEQLAMVQFSSGTTVDPKPVALSHRAVVAQTRILTGLISGMPDYTTEGVSWLPLYHDMGLIGCVFPALLHPGTLTLLPPEEFIGRPALWLRAIGRYGAFTSPAPNFAYALCVDRVRDEEMEGVDLSRWGLALNGAEPVAPQVLRNFQERFARWGLRPSALTPVYGLSEASLAVSFSRLDKPFASACFDRAALSRGEVLPAEEGQELVSVGQAVPGFSLRILDSYGQPSPADRVGHVWAKGPSLMDGYLDQPDATAEAIVDGWLNTGDLGFFYQGELYLTGRAKDVLILRGRNHAPQAVEQAVDRVPGVRVGCAAAVSVMPEGGDTEALLLFVEHAADATAAQRVALEAGCKAAVLEDAGLRVDEVIVLAPGTLPRTSSGKIRRAVTLEQFQRGELVPPDPVTALRVLRLMARSAIALARMGRA